MATPGMKTKNKSIGVALNSTRPLTARAVAELCGVELKTVHNWAIDGRLPHFRTPGRHLRFHPDAVAAFLRECGDEQQARRQRVLCITRTSVRRMRSALAVVDCTWVPDLWAGFLAIGKTGPDAVIVEASVATTTIVEEALRVLRREMPHLVIVVVESEGRRTPIKVKGLAHCTVGELGDLFRKGR